MKCIKLIGVVLVIFVSSAWCMPPTTTTARSTPPIGDSLKKLTKQLMDINSTSIEMLDVRTPPKIKQQQKYKLKHHENVENSHAGVAIPIEDEDVAIEESTKKINFYKLDRPTTNSGLSTWILLSGQITTPKTTTKKSVIKHPIAEVKPSSEEKIKEDFTVVVDSNANKVKPTFKKRGTTTTTTTTTEKPTTKLSSTVPTTKITKETTKLTKIKASDLNTAVNKKNVTTTSTTSPTKKTPKPNSTTESSTNITTSKKNEVLSTTNSSSLKLEGKNEEIEINNNATEDKKKKTKRKKNKNRRRKPEKSGNTDLVKPIFSQEKISTQLYNYLAREIMPTVGAGLVGLMVTAGLATYFLYPFGAARRTDDIDRKDKEGNYYYSDDYSGGMPEEEAIGKVIAGMPTNSLVPSNYQSSTTRSPYSSNVHSKYRLVDRRANIPPQNYEGFVKGSVENVPLNADDYKPYKNEVDTKKFVVGNVPTFEEATPVTVPEHGPRNMRFQDGKTSLLIPAYEPRSMSARQRSVRKRRSAVRRHRSGISNELDGDIPEDATVKIEPVTENTFVIANVTEISISTTTPSLQDKIGSLLDTIKAILRAKAVFGLFLIQNLAQSVSKYISDVQMRLDEQYRNYTRVN